MSFNKYHKQDASINKIKNISIGKKAFLYIFFMGVIGAIAGTVDSQIAIKKCINSENCDISHTSEIQISKISIGSCAGMIAATVLSIPALLEEKN